MPLFVERKPKGKDSHKHCIALIEGERKGGNIRVVAPEIFRLEWPIVKAEDFQKVSERAGSPRLLTLHQMEQIRARHSV